MERLLPLLSDETVFNIAVSGGKGDPKAPWPEAYPAREWGKVTDPSDWAERWRWRCELKF